MIDIVKHASDTGVLVVDFVGQGDPHAPAVRFNHKSAGDFARLVLEDPQRGTPAPIPNTPLDWQQAPRVNVILRSADGTISASCSMDAGFVSEVLGHAQKHPEDVIKSTHRQQTADDADKRDLADFSKDREAFHYAKIATQPLGPPADLQFTGVRVWLNGFIHPIDIPTSRRLADYIPTREPHTGKDALPADVYKDGVLLKAGVIMSNSLLDLVHTRTGTFTAKHRKAVNFDVTNNTHSRDAALRRAAALRAEAEYAPDDGPEAVKRGVQRHLHRLENELAEKIAALKQEFSRRETALRACPPRPYDGRRKTRSALLQEAAAAEQRAREADARIAAPRRAYDNALDIAWSFKADDLQKPE